MRRAGAGKCEENGQIKRVQENKKRRVRERGWESEREVFVLYSDNTYRQVAPKERENERARERERTGGRARTRARMRERSLSIPIRIRSPSQEAQAWYQAAPVLEVILGDRPADQPGLLSGGGDDVDLGLNRMVREVGEGGWYGRLVRVVASNGGDTGRWLATGVVSSPDRRACGVRERGRPRGSTSE